MTSTDASGGDTTYKRHEGELTRPEACHIVVLAGDGIGAEVTPFAVRAIEAVADIRGYNITFDHELAGGASMETYGSSLTKEVVEKCINANAVLFGACSGPRKGTCKQKTMGCTTILRLRKALGLYANLRPCWIVSPRIAEQSSPVKWCRLQGTNFVIVRELAAGNFYGHKLEGDPLCPESFAIDEGKYTVAEITRIARVAGNLAMQRGRKVTSVDKANVLACSRLWRRVVKNIFEKEFPNVDLEHLYVDNAAMAILLRPASFDVILTSNLFGDILSDEASVLTGSIGLMGSCAIAENGNGIYEPIHGAAPDIAGKGMANPIASMLAGAMLLRHAANLHEEACLLEEACTEVLESGYCTRDIAAVDTTVVNTTAEVGNAILQSLVAKLRMESKMDKSLGAKPSVAEVLES